VPGRRTRSSVSSPASTSCSTATASVVSPRGRLATS
jgi:hypothetical protein